jgi:hypothetical protein
MKLENPTNQYFRPGKKLAGLVTGASDADNMNNQGTLTRFFSTCYFALSEVDEDQWMKESSEPWQPAAPLTPNVRQWQNNILYSQILHLEIIAKTGHPLLAFHRFKGK